MTFSEAISVLRNRVVGELDANFYSDVELLRLLVHASEEVAAAFKFPQAIHTASVPVNATNIPIPPDMLSVELGQVMVGGLRIRPVDFITIQDKLRLNTGLVECYYYDPRRASNILIAPRPSAATTATFEYTKLVYTQSNGSYVSPTSSSHIWGTVLSGGHWVTPLFPNFHHVPLYLAGILAFEMSQEHERAQYYHQRFVESVKIFGAYLNQTDLANLLIEQQARNQPQARGM